jgi:hypothetical protein
MPITHKIFLLQLIAEVQEQFGFCLNNLDRLVPKASQVTKLAMTKSKKFKLWHREYLSGLDSTMDEARIKGRFTFMDIAIFKGVVSIPINSIIVCTSLDYVI